jgi:gamma-glutamylcyclotransferase (GGCT)/AIG2-like uncharacterized protein YtfP
MTRHLVFVYGTLRRGGIRAMPSIFPDATFIDDAKVNGRLYDFGEYPGLLLDESNSPVVGEVYEVDDETLGKLDEIEAESHYLRKQFELSFDEDRRACWVYVFDPEFYSPVVLIESGDWIEYARTKTGLHADASPEET